MKYLTQFNTYSDYEAFTISSDFITPNVSLCVQQNELYYNPYIHNYSQDYLTTIALEQGTISFNIWKSMGTEYITSISYSTDNGETWTTTNNTNGKSEHLTISVNVNEGDKVLWKGDAQQTGYYDEDEFDDYFGSFFSSTCEFDVEGNLMSLLYGDNFIGQTDLTGKSYAFYQLFKDCSKLINADNLSLCATILAENCYSNMFKGCTSLTTAPSVLPATTLIEYCYENMFYGCTSLTTAPELPATTLAISCYQYMFGGCTALTTAPELPATTLAISCYQYMFQGCTNLTTAPHLSATTLANSCCQYMFQGCTNLTTAPHLFATTLANSCYFHMFEGCTSLTTAPELPATTLARSCYCGMFYNCIRLTTAPELPATTLTNYCYQYMFQGCTNLNYIKAMFTTTPSTTYTNTWVSGVAATGTFVKNSAATWTTTGTSGIPTGWTVQTVAA